MKGSPGTGGACAEDAAMPAGARCGAGSVRDRRTTRGAAGARREVWGVGGRRSAAPAATARTLSPLLPKTSAPMRPAAGRATRGRAAASAASPRARRPPPRTVHVAALRNVDPPAALLFDCDGVLVDTERDGHRPAFNRAFKEAGLDHEWGVDLYGELLEIGGGKERMTHYFSQHPDTAPWATVKDDNARAELVKGLHLRKTEIFMAAVEAGAMPLRPGVARLVGEAMTAGVPVAVCSTSNEKAVSTIVRVLLGEAAAAAMPVFAGDVVPRKKPAPDIYLLAADTLGVDPGRCVVVEDSEIGLAAARAAGMRCVVTRSAYTQEEAFDGADAVFDCIGDKGEERFSLDDVSTPGAFWLAPATPRAA